jgi:hypothetical protein
VKTGLKQPENGLKNGAYPFKMAETALKNGALPFT